MAVPLYRRRTESPRPIRADKSAAMDDAVDCKSSAAKARQEHNKRYENKFSDLIKAKKEGTEKLKLKLSSVFMKPPAIDMTYMRTTGEADYKIAAAIEKFYANDGRFLDPNSLFPLGVVDAFGKDYTFNAMGIYYRNDSLPQFVTCNRKIWLPSFAKIDWEDAGEASRRTRARVLAKHSRENEAWKKSEYAWEADAWSDVFGEMRNDPCLEVDKHDYFTMLAKTNPILCTLTGESDLVKRTPDATFGLATFSRYQSDLPVWAQELQRSPLEKLLLHPKCGLLADPKWGAVDLAFPFAVYEAKGWSGDCREARRQACLAAATYLDRLDDLAHTPGPVGSTKAYQTATSHNYQVFALTSFGAYWHLLVGYRRPRQVSEYAGTKGMSETVYVFQRIWSGRVVDERTAWELLSLVDQIHSWAITDFRAFVLEHLRPWHRFCEENYLLDWNSVHDCGPEHKTARICSQDEDLILPTWVDLVSEPFRQKVQVRAKVSWAEALKQLQFSERSWNSNGLSEWVCTLGFCGSNPIGQVAFGSKDANMDHLRGFHNVPEEDLVQILRCFNEADEEILRKITQNSPKECKPSTSKRGRDEEGSNSSASSSPEQYNTSTSKRVRRASLSFDRLKDERHFIGHTVAASVLIGTSFQASTRMPEEAVPHDYL